MKRRPALAAVAALLMFSPAHAEEQVIAAPGEGWHIRFDAPRHIAVASPAMAVNGGRSDRVQLTFFVSPPRCPGGDAGENIYQCFATALKKNPLVVWETERGNTVPNGVQVMYLARLGDGKSFNIHLLFARNGKWADVHASVAAPTKDDITMLAAAVNSIVIEDDAPAGQ